VIIETIAIGLAIYVGMGLLTCLIKRTQIKQFAALLAPILTKEIPAEEQIQLEAYGITVEQTTIWAGYIYCFFKWPEAIHSNLDVWVQQIAEKKNVQR
jgi:hypothetical protein